MNFTSRVDQSSFINKMKFPFRMLPCDKQSNTQYQYFNINNGIAPIARLMIYSFNPGQVFLLPFRGNESAQI